ncbi:23S rRNA (cytidine(2498)-2'-O)-methyltransferase RlmM [Pseudazoarcus pumilus]|uniref:Ribosomal RNA large subunit methyltransferase M n=1 Tax=Pseudazoarcus pumilus TaxID=2067960 RepID=A0A2I6S8K9_9RHOO|nr:23S rRNA (cytidine(2498)-2'-O)-methyltransferase RlmM [Pseudazoarcus pumilus]AUN95588.1 23S rRNA (cytidine(2498)-2'-O)-methyltransferase RlmM [Pseudazoarcus pumilus]
MTREDTPTPPEEAHAWGLIALCRAGFERELAGELDAFARELGLNGYVRANEGTGFAVFEAVEAIDFADLAQYCDWHALVFARTLMPWFARVDDLPEGDRAGPVVEAARAAGQRFSTLAVEHPDSDAARPLSGFCRRVAAPLAKKLAARGAMRVSRKGLANLHVIFTDEKTAWLAASRADREAPWPMGIARLRMPREAASRSTLKLAEAILGMLTEEERTVAMRAGMRAVDLGAAPGGWSWQLAWRGLHVTAIDNGPMADSVMATSMVEHVRADGFTWRPKRAVDWLVCDMVEQPSRIASLMAEWIGTARARHAIFNLKLPMKRRLDAVAQCRSLIEKRLASVGPFELRIKHLYHDREEVTAYLTLRR